LSKTKCGYFINHGLAPHFEELLLQDVKTRPFYVLSFDESLSEFIQKEQMDLQIRYWNNKQNMVLTRYLDSYFLQRPNAKNLCDALLSALKDLDPKQLGQLSMDGPATNWNVLQLLHDDREEKEYPTIVNIGSCSLHVLHGAFKSGMEAASWDVGKVLKAIWQIFHDSPARRFTHFNLMI